MAILLNLLLLLVSLLIAAYLAACLFLFGRQTRMMFFPSPVIEVTPDVIGLDYEEVWLPVGKLSADKLVGKRSERLHGWWIPASGTEVGVVLYLHGNGINIGANLGQASRFHQLNLSVLLIDYRGYGLSEGGFPHEQQVYQDAEVGWQYLTQTRQIPPQRLFIYGHSMGGAIAINLASQHPNAAGLMVQSSFTSMRDMVGYAARYDIFPIDLLLTQRFDSIRKVPTLKMPLLLIHGLEDTEVPAEMSQALYAAAPEPKQLYLVPIAGHNDVGDTAGAEYLHTVQEFVQRCLQLKGEVKIS